MGLHQGWRKICTDAAAIVDIISYFSFYWVQVWVATTCREYCMWRKLLDILSMVFYGHNASVSFMTFTLFLIINWTYLLKTGKAVKDEIELLRRDRVCTFQRA